MFPNPLVKASPFIALIVVIVGSLIVGHVKGTATCEIKNSNFNTLALEKDGESYDKIHIKNSKLNDPDVDNSPYLIVRAK